MFFKIIFDIIQKFQHGNKSNSEKDIHKFKIKCETKNINAG